MLGAASLDPGKAIGPSTAVVDCASSSLHSGRSGLKVSLVSSKCLRFRRREPPVTLAELELLGQLGHQGPLDLPARKEKLVPKVHLEIQGAQDHKVHKETVVFLGYRDCKDPWDQQDLVAHR
ncbi:hypothetical protein HPB50_008111 [Hyalomma asiaticum]|uniref:Uncharacterized protein n=1 Tax=Hyalomma asiaticum TaxID=266040 RepID=A0ACB7S5N5_HYAAI|nr:hypothetical protein HPB50_008111 [Hyalomma asiaticum]